MHVMEGRHSTAEQGGWDGGWGLRGRGSKPSPLVEIYYCTNCDNYFTLSVLNK